MSYKKLFEELSAATVEKNQDVELFKKARIRKSKPTDEAKEAPTKPSPVAPPIEKPHKRKKENPLKPAPGTSPLPKA